MSTNPTNDGPTTNDTDRKDPAIVLKNNNLSATTSSVDKMNDESQGQNVCQNVFNPPTSLSSSLEDATNKTTTNNNAIPHTVSNFVMPAVSGISKPTSQPLQPVTVMSSLTAVTQQQKENDCIAINNNSNQNNQHLVGSKFDEVPKSSPMDTTPAKSGINLVATSHLQQQPLAPPMHHLQAIQPLQPQPQQPGLIIPKEEVGTRSSPGEIKVKNNLTVESEPIMPSAVKPSAVKPELKEPGVPLGLPSPMPLSASNFRPGFPSFSPFAPYAVNNSRPPLSLPPGVPPSTMPLPPIPAPADPNAPLTIDDSSNSNSSSRTSPRVIPAGQPISVDGQPPPHNSLMPKYLSHQPIPPPTSEPLSYTHPTEFIKTTASPVQKR